ncbi:MAG: hypothetical protein FWD03_06705, partial [Defluviitaleaceae bacterium]|nr:hypothetical protein [Defluviitaleaceae bacterium]
AFITTASIQVVSLIQGSTPTELTGKVMSLLMMLPFLANALGQLVYGVFFEQFVNLPYVVMFATVVMVVFIAIYTRRSLRRA